MSHASTPESKWDCVKKLKVSLEDFKVGFGIRITQLLLVILLHMRISPLHFNPTLPLDYTWLPAATDVARIL